MISNKTLKAIEYDKILKDVAKFAVLEETKESLASFVPLTALNLALDLQAKTEEAVKYLFNYSVAGVYYFDNVSEELKRVEVGGTLNNLELLKIAGHLKSARIARDNIESVSDNQLTKLLELAKRLYVNQEFEKEITDKIISEDEISDHASPKLYQIRKSIANLNAKIRERLNSYIRGGLNKYLQDCVVTMRQDRYVIPVKSEYRSMVKGFIHDQSASRATVFIEPEQIMELNNDLKRALFDEKEEIYRILAELSQRVSFISDALRYNAENLIELDSFYARAKYAYKNKCVKPILNCDGKIIIENGRHPLIPIEKVVPVSLNIGQNYNFLLVTGPNTGGKTVTLKLTGLFSAMAMSGLFIPASYCEISVFNGIYCDIGDEQSIEQNLSTFSSHIKNIIEIIQNVDNNSLVLLDELGAGTDPEEGSALALSIIKKLLDLNCFGIITTHYSRLKEFAVGNEKIENASMEFDPLSLKPLYKLNIGIPGSSNAIEIAKTLGLDGKIINDALGLLSNNQISFEKVLKKAEESRRIADNLSVELEKIKADREIELENIKQEKEKIVKEKERIYFTAKQETKRIVSDKLSEAEEIIDELKKILKNAELESRDFFKANELKNRLKNSKYLSVDIEESPITLQKAHEKELKIGNRVFVKSLGSYAKLASVKLKKGEAEVLIGNIKTVVKTSDLYNSEEESIPKEKIKIFKKTSLGNGKSELNVVGKTSLEAISELELFIDQAIINNLTEIKVIHGVGEGILLKEIRSFLKKDKNILEYRKGKYGEGENGVTIITLK